MELKIESTKTLSKGSVKALIYGVSGAGKTTLAGTLPGKTLIISCESGLLSLQDKEIDVYDLNKLPDACHRIEALQKIAQALRAGELGEYQNIFIDSLSEVSHQMLVCLRTKYPDKSDGFKMWGEYNEKMHGLVRFFRDLNSHNVIFTALQETDKDESGRRFYGIQMFGKISTQVEALLDEVFCLRVVEDEEGNEKRALLTKRLDNYMAKDRSGRLERYEPCDLSVVLNKIGA